MFCAVLLEHNTTTTNYDRTRVILGNLAVGSYNRGFFAIVIYIEYN